MSDPIPAGILTRVSSLKQAEEGDSLDYQEIRCQAYAESKGWSVVAVYRLEGVSGKDVANHPETRRMLDDVKAGRIKVLTFARLDRLARNFHAMVKISAFFKEADAHFASLAESLDTSTSIGRAFFWILAILAELEREKIAERVAEVVPVRAAMGRNLGGVATYGYQWGEDGLLKIKEDEAAVRRLIYELFIASESLTAVAAELNCRSYRTRAGAEWTSTQVGRMIIDPTAMGQKRSNWSRSPKAGEGTAPIRKPAAEWVYSEAPALVPVEIWERANRILKAQREARTPRARAPKHLLTGLIWCHCGSRMYANGKKPATQVYYCTDKACRNRRRCAEVEALFLRSFDAYCAPAAEVDQARRLLAAAKDKEALLGGRWRELAQLERDKAKVTADYLAGVLPAAFVAEWRTGYEARVTQITAEIPRLEGERDALRVSAEAAGQTLADVRAVRVTWDEMEFADRRALVDQIVARCTVGKKHVDFLIHPLPTVMPPSV